MNKPPLAMFWKKTDNRDCPSTIYSLPISPKSPARPRANIGNQMPMPQSAMRPSARDPSGYSSGDTIAGTVEMCFAGDIRHGRYLSTRTGTITQTEGSTEDVDTVGECIQNGKKTSWKRPRGGKALGPIPPRKLWARGLARVRMTREAVWRQA